MNKSQPKNFVEGPFAYGQEIVLEISDLNNLGVGVGRIDNFVVMVPFALNGEKVKARVFRNHKNYSEADLLEVIEASPEREKPFCPLFEKCGGCQYQHLKYEAQLKYKQKQIGDLFERIGGVKAEISPTYPSPKISGYRSKLTPHYEKPNKNGEMPIGFIMQGRRHTLVDVSHCPIASESINAELIKARAHVQSIAHKLKRGGTILLRDCFEGVVQDNNAIVTTRVSDFSFQFGAGDFFQNNPYILPDFINYAIEEAKGSRFLVDAYCGVGLFAICASKHFEKVSGVEISAKSIMCANANAKINNVKNCDFMIGSSEEIFKEIKFPASDCSMIIDPPRSGCSTDFLEQLCAYAPKRLVYVSCGPDTQARDIAFLTKNNYKLLKVQPFDMFPQTRHIESIATLELI